MLRPVAIVFVVTVIVIAILLAPVRLQAQQDSSAVIETALDDLRDIVNRVGKGRSLQPAEWPHDARVAVLLSFDTDDETVELRSGGRSINVLSDLQYGRVGLNRIVDLLDRHNIPATFFVPGVSLELDPQKATVINRSGRHEFAVHGWIHENPASLSRAQEKAALERSLETIRKSAGYNAVGYRAPSWNFSEHTVDILGELGFFYDSSLMSDDSPYEILRHGQATGIVELPVSWVPDDASYLLPRSAGAISPRDFLTILKDDFDVAYRERTMFLVTMHPDIIGRRSAIVVLEELIDYIKSKPGVWFATHRSVAEYAKKQAVE